MPSRYTFPEAPTLDAQDDVLTVRLLPPEDLITYLAIALQNTSDGDDVDRIASSLVRKYDETHTGIWNRWIGVYAQDSGRLIG